MSRPEALARDVRRLAFDPNDPRSFDHAKRDIASRVAALALTEPCATCPAGHLRTALDATRRALRTERERVATLERLLAIATRPRAKPIERPDEHQLAFWPDLADESADVACLAEHRARAR